MLVWLAPFGYLIWLNNIYILREQNNCIYFSNYANIPQQHQNWQLQHQNQAQTLPTAQGPM